MASAFSAIDTHWLFLISPLLSHPLLLGTTIVLSLFLAWLFTPGGTAWTNRRTHLGLVPIPGPRGLPVIGSLLSLTSPTPHCSLATLSSSCSTTLMALSIGSTPAVVSSDPTIAKELLSHPALADRPLKRSARDLMFSRAIGFAPNGPYWRLLRSIAASHLFAPKRLAAHEDLRRSDCDVMVRSILREQRSSGHVTLRPHLQMAALNSIMGCVFGKRYVEGDGNGGELEELRSMVREGFELLGAFNWSDHLPWLTSFYDPHRIGERCAKLVPRVRSFVKRIIVDHRRRRSSGNVEESGDFVDVLLSRESEAKLSEDDMIAILWEMVFRGTDTTALLTEWAMAELVLNPTVQSKLRRELEGVVGPITDTVAARLPYLQGVVKEALRAHPPGPLLSWARLSTADIQLSNGMLVPAGTTAMVNMWAIAHDSTIWVEPERFLPDRFVPAFGGVDFDVRGGDTRLAPFGAGRRVCPGKNLALVTVAMWIARLVVEFKWTEDRENPVELAELLKLSCEMKKPLVAVAVPLRN